MAEWAYLNDAFIPEEDCLLPAGDLAVQRGYGVFDYFKTRAGSAVLLDEHLARFYRSAAALRLAVGKPAPTLKAIIEQLVQKNALHHSGVRLTLTGGASPDSYSIGAPNLVITQHPLVLPSEATFEKGLTLTLYAHQRQLPHVKSIDYLMAIWLRPLLAENGTDEVLYYNNNEVRECPRANFFIVTETGAVVTPGQGILKGITRQQVLQAAGSAAGEGVIRLADLAVAQEAFITSTTKGILPVVAINGKPIGSGKPGPVTRKLAAQLVTAPQMPLPDADG